LRELDAELTRLKTAIEEQVRQDGGRLTSKSDVLMQQSQAAQREYAEVKAECDKLGRVAA